MTRALPVIFTWLSSWADTFRVAVFGPDIHPWMTPDERRKAMEDDDV